MEPPDPPPDDALDDIASLSRSKPRVWILATLSTEAATRGELEDATGIPRTTIDRVVNELADRGWITRTADGKYTATSIGERIAAESRRFIAAITAIRNLREAVTWLPTDELTIGLHHFSDATVRRPEPNDLNAPDTFATELIRKASDFACLVNTPPSLAFEQAMMDGVSEGRLQTNHVITTEELEVLCEDTERASHWAAYVDAGANLYCYDGRIPCNLIVIDDTTLILDRQPEAPEGIVSTRPSVRSWARELIGEYRDDAERIHAAAFR